jgi:hypothetical protein
MTREREAIFGPAVDEVRSLLAGELEVPIRTSSGEQPDPARLPIEAFRHGEDDRGRFLAAYTRPELFERYGPPGSDAVRIEPRDFFERAERAGERVVVDPGSPTSREVAVDALPLLAAGIEPDDLATGRMRRNTALPQLSPPDQVPSAFGEALRGTLTELPQVERAWLLRSRGAWTIGIQMVPSAVLADFDEVRNRLHALANEHLGTRRNLAVTDLRAPVVREQYDAVAAPFFERRKKGFLSRLVGR